MQYLQEGYTRGLDFSAKENISPDIAILQDLICSLRPIRVRDTIFIQALIDIAALYAGLVRRYETPAY